MRLVAVVYILVNQVRLNFLHVNVIYCKMWNAVIKIGNVTQIYFLLDVEKKYYIIM